MTAPTRTTNCSYCRQNMADPGFDRCTPCRTWRDEEWCEANGHQHDVPPADHVGGFTTSAEIAAQTPAGDGDGEAKTYTVSWTVQITYSREVEIEDDDLDDKREDAEWLADYEEDYDDGALSVDVTDRTIIELEESA